MAKASSSLHTDTILTDMAVRHPNHEMIADDLAPPLQVKKRSDIYYYYGSENLRAEDDFRANGAESNEAGFTILGDDGYYVNEYALHDVVTDEDRENQDDPIDAEADTVFSLTEKLHLGREIRLATLALTAANYTSGYSETVATKWSDYTNSTPVTDIRAGMQAIHAGGVAGPYGLMLGKEVYDVLIDHPDILERLKYTSSESVTTEALARILQVQKISIGEAVKDSASEGQTPSIGYVWGKTAIAYSIAPQRLKAPGFIRTFHDELYGGMMEVRRFEKPWLGKGATQIEVALRYVPKMISVDNLTNKDTIAGYLFLAAVA